MMDTKQTDVTVRDTQPRVKVGNARSGTGTVVLDPSRVYTAMQQQKQIS